jgi:hypothetical protein
MATPRTRVALVVSTGFCLLLLAPVCFGLQDDDDASLKSLFEAHRWFELREAVEKGGAPAFYQGAVACAFNDLHRCEKKLSPVIKSRPQSHDTIEAHRLLASASLRRGRYRLALAQADAVIALKPGDSGVLGDRPLLAILSQFPEQEVVRRRATMLQLQEAGLPIWVNGVKATYWFDTGANVSAISESEAKRFGLRVVASPIEIGDVTGTKFDSRVGVADEVSIGSIRLRHVVFLVLSDSQPPFNQLTPGEGGLIGLPVILALQRLVWGADKKFEIGSKSSDTAVPHADMCFDGQHPVTQIQYEHRQLLFTLDTGATNTDLYPPFAAAFPELIRMAEKSDAYKMEGAGGARNMDAAILKSLRLSIGGFPVVLSPAGVLLTHTVEESKFFHGNLGIDLLQQAHKTTFDFKAMTLTLE